VPHSFPQAGHSSAPGPQLPPGPSPEIFSSAKLSTSCNPNKIIKKLKKYLKRVGYTPLLQVQLQLTKKDLRNPMDNETAVGIADY
jgi:hypothetical protein